VFVSLLVARGSANHRTGLQMAATRTRLHLYPSLGSHLREAALQSMGQLYRAAHGPGSRPKEAPAHTRWVPARGLCRGRGGEFFAKSETGLPAEMQGYEYLNLITD